MGDSLGEIRNAQGERLDYTWTEGDGRGRNVVVIGHGVTANKDRPFLVALGEGLRAAGVASLRFSFAGNGESAGRFVASTISKEVEDLGAVLDAVAAGDANRRLIYAGHSMGGAVGILRAARDPRIRALVSLAGMVHTADFARRKFGGLVPGRDTMWDKPECPLSREFMDDMAAIDTVIQAAGSITVPWLLVHGTADEVVLPQDSRDVISAAAKPPGGKVALQELPGVDHVFTGEGTARMVEVVVPWIVGLDASELA